MTLLWSFLSFIVGGCFGHYLGKHPATEDSLVGQMKAAFARLRERFKKPPE